MDDRAALLRAILDDPEDDLVRLVFADWLQDHGEEPFAHFIRRQVAIRAAGDDALAVERIRYEYRGLIPEGEKFPMPEWDDYVNRQDREGGFLETISMGPSGWEEYRDRLMGTEPIRSLKLLAFEEENPWDCLRHPANARLRSLTINRHSTTEADIIELTAIPTLANLERLDLSRQVFGEEGFKAISRSPILRRLRELDLSDCPGGWDCPRFIASVEWPELRRLNLNAVGAFSAGAEFLTASTGFPQLRSLHLGGSWRNHIGDRGARMLAASSLLGGLWELDLNSAGITDDGIEALAGSPRMARLRRLNLSRNEFTARGLRALFSSPHLVELRSLNISDNDKDRGPRPPGPPTWGSLRNLRHLKLNERAATRMEFADLMNRPDAPPLESLELSGESLGVAAWKAIRDGSTVRSSLRTLKISPKSVSPAALKVIANIEWVALGSLHLESCNLTRGSLQILAEGGGLTGLRLLSLKGNETLRDDMIAFVDADLPALEILDLRGIRTSGSILDQILSSPTMPRLTTLYVDSQQNLLRLSKKYPRRLVRV